MDKLIAEYKDLSYRAFMVNMADHLSSEDYDFLDECHKRMTQIKNELSDNGINIEEVK